MGKKLAQQLAGMLEHSPLNPMLTRGDIEAACEFAVKNNIASVVVQPVWASLCAHRLAGSPVSPSVVIGFPHGTELPSVKIFAIEKAIDDGAVEIDAVVSIGKVKSGDWDYAANEIKRMTNRAHKDNARIKIIFENCYLTEAEKMKLCKICGDCGVDWMKTSTGFGESGATIEDLKLMVEHAAPGVKVKASGGIRTLRAALAARDTGADRIGTSRTPNILREALEAPDEWVGPLPIPADFEMGLGFDVAQE